MELEGTDDVATLDAFRESYLQVQNFLKVFLGEGLKGWDWKIKLIFVSEIDYFFCPFVYFVVIWVVYEVTTDWGIILDFDLLYVSGLLMDDIVLFFLNEFDFFYVPFLRALLIGIDLLLLFLAERLLDKVVLFL